MSERVAVLSSSYPREAGDAAGHFVASEVRRLVHAGHEVHVLAPGLGPASADGATLHWLRDQGAFGWPGATARLKERPTRWLGALEFCVRARRKLAQLGPFTRLQAHFLVPCAWPIASGAQHGRNCALEIVGHGSDVRLFCRLPHALRRHVARAWLARAAQVRVTSAELAQLLSQANPELYGLIRVEASPLDVHGAPTREAARRTLALHDAPPLALIVSRLVPEKRVALALQALSLLEPLQAVVVGDGPELAALRVRFPEVRFLGHLPRPEALTWIAAADVLVSASAHEGAPSVVREARALGVPVVAVAAGDLAAWAKTDPGLISVAH